MADENATELLAQLKGIQLPEAPHEPSIWPLVIALVLVALAGLAFIISRHHTRPSWARQAHKELDSIERNNAPDALHQTAVLLKRIVLTHDENTDIKHLSGDPWLQYLDSFFSTRYFSEGDGHLLGSALYQRSHRPPAGIYAELRQLIRRRDKSHD